MFNFTFSCIFWWRETALDVAPRERFVLKRETPPPPQHGQLWCQRRGHQRPTSVDQRFFRKLSACARPLYFSHERLQKQPGARLSWASCIRCQLKCIIIFLLSSAPSDTVTEFQQHTVMRCNSRTHPGARLPNRVTSLRRTEGSVF